MSAAAALSIPALLAAQGTAAGKCAPDNVGIKVPAGFCVTLFADSIPGVRSLAVAPNGDVFAAVQGRTGAGVVALRDAGNTGHATTKQQFASGFTSSQIALFDRHVYTEAAQTRPQGANASAPAPTIAIVRFPLKAGELTPSGPADTIVSGLPGAPGHVSRNFTITPDGVLYVNVGSPTNSCQSPDRKAGAPGANPCTELDTRAGIWKFDARKKNQTQVTGVHFARGIRNAVGVAISPVDGKLWAMQHGRDQLSDWRDKLGLDSAAAARYSAENPAEQLMQVNQGEDYGWPYCYYAADQHHLVLAPEYGGDGKKTAQCAQKHEPVATFPGHWAPNALFFYTGSSFPARYKNGAFIAFHGSWNRAPEPQAGYNVVFQPLKGTATAGKYEVFAEGFSPSGSAGRASAAGGYHRPTGLAQAADGSLYVADDTGGRIYKIVYTGK
ncbi:MAG: L-sorbosone dehydrogenase [Gemmatimonadetes bacterium]|nr:L-sorbosone dehydrogenase [Gemmatimonadota bacterium]